MRAAQSSWICCRTNFMSARSVQCNLRCAPCLDGPTLDLMLYCHGLKILNNFQQGISCFYFALGLANYAASLICHMVLKGIGSFPPNISRKSSLFPTFIFVEALNHLRHTPMQALWETVLTASCGDKNETDTDSGCATLPPLPCSLIPTQELPCHFPERSLFSISQ